MKRGTPRHPKLATLAIALNIPTPHAAGILELLWHFTAEFAHAGDVGKFTDEAIAKAVCWDRPSSILVSCLLETRWLDACPCHRLRIHDWPDHADQTVERVLAKRGQRFLKCYDETSIILASSQHRTSQPSPIPIPSPIPNGDPEFTEEMALKWLKDAQKNGADYTEAEMHKAFLAGKGNGWKWAGADKRAALERQIIWDRERMPVSAKPSTNLSDDELLRNST